MTAPTENQLVASRILRMMTALQTTDTTIFTPSGSAPAYEATGTAFPNSRNEKFEDYTTTQNYTWDATGRGLSNNVGAISFWIKPDFAQSYGTNRSALRFAWTDSPLTKVDGLEFLFRQDQDDLETNMYVAGASKASALTVGQTWAADSVLHVVILWNNVAGLDGSKSLAMYINNNLAATATGTWNSTNAVGPRQKIGYDDYWTTRAWDGGIFDVAFFDYATLASSFTDAEIVQALYSNTYSGGTTHKFAFELANAAPPIAPSGLYVDTIGLTSCILHWTDNSGDELGFKIYQDGVLIDTVATAGLTSYSITGLTADTTYYFSVKAYNANGDSTATSDVYITTDGYGITVKGRKGRLSNSTSDVLQWNSSGINYEVLVIRTVTAAYTVDSYGPYDRYIRANGTFTVTLPTAADFTGRLITVKNIGTGSVTCNSVGMDPGYCVTWISNGATWETWSIGATIV